MESALDRAQSDVRVFVPQITAEDLAGRITEERRIDLENRMGYHTRAFPAVLNYRVFDGRGQSLFGAGANNPRLKFNVADRAWFRQLRDDPDRDLIISEVVIGKSVQDQTIILAVPIRDGERHLAGAVVAAINLPHFQRLIDALDIGARSLIAVRRTDDYRLVLRRPQLAQSLNATVTGSALSNLIQSDQKHGQGEFTSPLDHHSRTFAFRTLDNYPFSVIVAVAAEDYLASWREQTMVSGAAALVLIAIMVALYRRQLRSQSRVNAYAEALRTSERHLAGEAFRFRQLLRTASDGIHILDERGDLVLASESFYRMLGYDENDPPPLHVGDWDAQWSRPDLQDILLKLIHANASDTFTTRHRRQDATILDVEIHSRAVELDGRRFLYNSSRDITQRLMAEAQIARGLTANTILAKVLRLSLTDMPLDRILDAALGELLALPWLNLENRGCVFLVDQGDRSLRMAAERNLSAGVLANCQRVALGHCLCGRAAARMEVLFKAGVDGDHDVPTDGQAAHGHYCVPIVSGGDLVGVLNTYVSHGHVREGEEERALLMFADTLAGIIVRKGIETTLRESEELAKTLMNATTDAALLMDAQGVILASNAALAAHFHVPRETLVGRSFFDLLPPGLAASRRPLMEQVVASGEPLHTHDERDGLVLENHIHPVLDPSGQTAMVAVFSRDVTEQRRAEAAVEKALADLARSNAELEQFAYVTSHDLRQPLRAVTSYLTLIQHALADTLDSETTEYLSFAIGGAKRMDELILGLLEYSRVGRRAPPFETVSLTEIVATSVRDLQFAIEDAGAEVVVADDLPSVHGAPIELVRLFQNLIGNALKYQPAERQARVSVGWRDDGARWSVWVRDNGIGIESKDYDRAFGIFQRLVSNELYEGTGIGLAICRKIVEHHGGRIWIESTPGEGSTFLVAFPKARMERD